MPTVPPTSPRPQVPASAPAYTLYFTQPYAEDPLQPMKRLRFSAAADAVDRALEMRREGRLKPVEIRDEQGRLVTCELIGWRFSPLAPRSAPSQRPDLRWRSPV